MGPLSKMTVKLEPKPAEGSGEVDMGDEDEGGMAQAKLDAAQAVADALGVKPKSLQALSDALEEHYACCQGED